MTNGLLSFIILGIYTPLERGNGNALWYGLPIDGQLYLHCSLIYFWVPSSCFCIVISLSLRAKYSRSAVSASRGEAALSTPEAVVSH